MPNTSLCVALLGAALLATQASAQPTGGAAPRVVPAEREIVSRLSHMMDSLVARGEFSGVVLLARHATPVFEQAYGYADREHKLLTTPETAFNLGSINKMFTATAVRQLVAAGKLSLDSTISSYWPDYPNAEAAHRVTIGQLVEHRGGLGGNIFGEPASGSRHDIRHNRHFVPLFASEPLAFAPGTKQAYSNAGYVVLGNIVERVSGEDYYDYVRRHIYEPAGLTHTAHYAVDSLPPNTAIGYTTHSERGDSVAMHPNGASLPGRGSSAGGGYSTARDLARFIQALRENKVPNGPRPGIGVAGGSGGVNAVLEGELPGGYDLVVMSNLDPPAAERVARLVCAMLGVRGDN